MEFVLREAGGVRWLTCPLLGEGEGPAHAFGLRAAAREPPADAQGLLEALGRPSATPLPLRQGHGAQVVKADTARGFPAEADAAVTVQPGLAPMVRTADCVPLLLWDPHGGAVGAVHAGWRGILAGVVEAAVAELQHAFGVRPDRLVAAVGPAIGPCCYEVGPDVASRFDPSLLRPGFSRRPHLDLWAAARLRLQRSGLEAGRISVARLCTACRPEWFVSWRRDGETPDRLVSLITP